MESRAFLLASTKAEPFAELRMMDFVRYEERGFDNNGLDVYGK